MTLLQGFDLYGGAAITRVVDGAGAEWIGCTGKNASGAFGFYAFKNGVNVPLTPFCSGRGTIGADGHWIAWEGAHFFTGALPGFVAFPSMVSLLARIAELEGQVHYMAALAERIGALERTIAGSPPVISNGVLTIPGQPGMPIEGGEIHLTAGDGGPPFIIDVRGARLRFIRNGTVIDFWPK